MNFYHNNYISQCSPEKQPTGDRTRERKIYFLYLEADLAGWRQGGVAVQVQRQFSGTILSSLRAFSLCAIKIYN